MGSDRHAVEDILAELAGESPAIEAVRENIRRLVARRTGARRPPSVLIQGETGTGKGLVALLIHHAGPRASGPFVDVNCAAIPDTLLEAELFGFERGAFTDARRAKAGLFQTAHRGTIFLDEVGLLPEPLQRKLLKVIEEQAVRRLGGTRSEPADVWIISATNSDLENAIRERQFREDLYHRLSVLTLRLPPLRERGRDVVLLAERFMARACEDYGCEPKRLTPSAENRLLAYPWPGNIRELFNVIERVVLLSEGPEVTAAMLPIPEGPARAPVSARVHAAAAEEAMRNELLAALEQTGWNISRTAALLGLSRVTVRARIERFGLRRMGDHKATRHAPASMPPAPAAAAGETAPIVLPSPARWENRHVTFLRARLLTTDDERLTEWNRAVESIIDKVRTFEGEIEELSPTGVGAVFGLLPIEDAPRRAAHAAMAIRKAGERARRRGERFEVKIAIHTAQVPVGHFGNTIAIDGDARRSHWDAVDALLAPTGVQGIVVSPQAAQFLERRFDLSGEPAPEGGGGTRYRLGGHERPGLGPKGRMTAFVGREEELALLRSRLESARGGHGQIVSLVGDAGIGKSRLLYEFRRSLRGENITFLEGHCLSYGSGIPYLPVLGILRQACRLTDLDTPKRIATKVRVTLERLAMDAEAALPYLLRFLGVKDETDTLVPMSADAVRSRTFDILRSMCARAAQRRPLVVAVEDAHWIDTASEALGALIGNLAGMPLLVILTYRPDYQVPWLPTSSTTQIALQPLSFRDSLSMISTLLPAERASEAVAHAILEKAEGNPFFVEELARAVAEQGDGDIPSVAHGPSSFLVPPTIHAVLAARIDRLPPEERGLLQCAAVIGKDVPFWLLEAIAGMLEADLRRSLAHLQARGFLYEKSLFPDSEYTFKHVLTHEVTYGSLLEGRQRALHAEVVEATERRYASRLSEHAAWLAHHAVRAETWQKAATYLWQAGRNARARSAYREAVAFLEQAVEVMRRLPPGKDNAAAVVDLICADLSDPLLTLTQYERVLGHLRDAAHLAETLGDRGRLANVAARTVVALRMTGQEDRAVEVGERAVALAQEVGDARLNVLASVELAFAHYGTGEMRRAEALLRQALDAVNTLPTGGEPDTQWLRRRTLGLLVLVLTFLGRYQEAVQQGEEAHRLAEELRQPGPIVGTLYRLGFAYARWGEVDKGIELCSRSLRLAREHKVPDALQGASASLGMAYMMAGRAEEAVRYLEEAVVASDSRYGLGVFVGVLLGQAYAVAGRVEDASRRARETLDMCGHQRRRHVEVAALHLAGDIAARREPPILEEAITYYGRALALAEELELSPDAARVHRALGTLYHRTGDRALAQRHLATALRMYREMGAPLSMAEVEAEISELR